MSVATKIFCHDKHVMTNVFLWQAYFCHDKRCVLLWQNLSRQKSYLWRLPPMMVDRLALLQGDRHSQPDRQRGKGRQCTHLLEDFFQCCFVQQVNRVGSYLLPHNLLHSPNALCKRQQSNNAPENHDKEKNCWKQQERKELLKETTMKVTTKNRTAQSDNKEQNCSKWQQRKELLKVAAKKKKKKGGGGGGKRQQRKELLKKKRKKRTAQSYNKELLKVTTTKRTAEKDNKEKNRSKLLHRKELLKVTAKKRTAFKCLSHSLSDFILFWNLLVQITVSDTVCFTSIQNMGTPPAPTPPKDF